jgi:phosphoglycerate dehydrogenase-like enzyme
MIGEEQFRKMKKTAWFINVARGDVVDEAAMIKALREGWIAGAGLDVFEKEPLPGDSPLWEMENVILTPHIAGPTPHYMERLMDIFIANMEAYKSGNIDKMTNVIDYDKQY